MGRETHLFGEQQYTNPIKANIIRFINGGDIAVNDYKLETKNDKRLLKQLGKLSAARVLSQSRRYSHNLFARTLLVLKEKAGNPKIKYLILRAK